MALYVLILAGFHEVVAFPIAFYHGFLLERRYGLSKEAPGGWLAIIRRRRFSVSCSHRRRRSRLSVDARDSMPWWWLISAGVFIAAIAWLTRLAPLLLLPLFYRFTPLARESLRDRLVALSNRAGVACAWRLRMGTWRENAAGRTLRWSGPVRLGASCSPIHCSRSIRTTRSK